jgi:NADH-quinone oxidoreductase subunit A
MTTDLWPFFAYLGAALFVLAAMLVLSWLLGQRHRENATNDPFESGMLPTGSARLRFDVRFYLVAMFFVIFDIESVFIFLWAVALRRVGWMGYIDIAVFIGLLLVALAYLWRIGGLEWGTVSRARRKEL